MARSSPLPQGKAARLLGRAPKSGPVRKDPCFPPLFPVFQGFVPVTEPGFCLPHCSQTAGDASPGSELWGPCAREELLPCWPAAEILFIPVSQYHRWEQSQLLLRGLPAPTRHLSSAAAISAPSLRMGKCILALPLAERHFDPCRPQHREWDSAHPLGCHVKSRRQPQECDGR